MDLEILIKNDAKWCYLPSVKVRSCIFVAPRLDGRYYGLVFVPPPRPPPPERIYVRASAGHSFKDIDLKFHRCLDICSMTLNINFWKNRLIC